MNLSKVLRRAHGLVSNHASVFVVICGIAFWLKKDAQICPVTSSDVFRRNSKTKYKLNDNQYSCSYWTYLFMKAVCVGLCALSFLRRDAGF